MRPWLLTALLVAGIAKSVVSQCQTAQLVPPLQSAGDKFGISLSIDGDELVVGADWSATVFVRDDQGTQLDSTDDLWSVQTQLLTMDPFFADEFGWAVSIQGDALAVGAPGHGGVARGAAYFYRRNANGTRHDLLDDTWIVETVAVPPLAGLSLIHI